MVAEDKKTKLIQVASSVFAKYGYDKTTLDDIGKAANLNKASLYYYFKNKEDIYSSVVAAEATTVFDTIQEKVSKQTSIEKKILFYLIDRVSYVDEAFNVHEVYQQTSNQMVPEICCVLYSKISEREIEYLTSLIKEGVKEGNFVKLNAKLFAQILIELSDAIKDSAIYQNRQEDQGKSFDFDSIKPKLTFAIKTMLNGAKKR